MARMIKETPILRGRDAERFRKDIRTVKKVPPKRKAEMEANYARLVAIMGGR